MEDQICVIKNVKNFFGLREKNVNFHIVYSILICETKYKAKHGKGLKILTPGQMLQRLPEAFVQVKTDNASQNFLNEIRKIIYPQY